jgi:hypothetical protein
MLATIWPQALFSLPGHYIPFVTPPNPYCHAEENRSAAFAMHKTHVECLPSVCRHKSQVLPNLASLAARYLPRTGHGRILPWPARYFDRETARQPFRRCIVSGTTREHANDHATALQHVRQAPACFLLRPHSPTTAFESPGLPTPGTGNHTGCRSGSCVSHFLHFTDHVATECYPGDTAVVCPAFQHGIVSTSNRLVISGGRT